MESDLIAATDSTDSLGISSRLSPIIARPTSTTEVPTTAGVINSVSSGQNSPTTTIATPTGSNMGVSSAGQVTAQPTAIPATGKVVQNDWRVTLFQLAVVAALVYLVGKYS